MQTGDNESSTPLMVWLAHVRASFKQDAPDILPLFDIYAGEAIFGLGYITSDLNTLKPGAKLMEVGAGSLLLSCHLVKAGFQVTAVEPIGSGFSHFDEMRDRVLKCAVELGCVPTLLSIAAEDIAECNHFDYAFSVNVMEHVQNVSRVIFRVCNGLVPGSSYRFTCPNYLFPYEPHFNIPTLISKKVTEVFFGEKIFLSARMPDPKGTWESLNWINILQVHRIVRSLPGLHCTFSRLLLVSTFERITSDSDFASRRSPVVRKLLQSIVLLRLHLMLKYIPSLLQPIMDCRVQRGSEFGGES